MGKYIKSKDNQECKKKLGKVAENRFRNMGKCLLGNQQLMIRLPNSVGKKIPE